MKNFKKYAAEGRIDENADLTDRQSIVINAPIDEVWAYIHEVEQWPEWNKNISGVALKGDGQDFNWHYDGRKFQSTFMKVEKPSSLAWIGTSGWIQSVYAWSLDATDTNQTVVSVEEGYKGFLLFLFMGHQKVHSNLLSWLNQLKQVAEKSTEGALV